MLAVSSSHSPYDIVVNMTIIFIAIGFILFSFSNKVRTAPIWKATVTPLASIIGSGFLVVTPLYLLILGQYAFFAITGMVCIAYLMGYVIRYNIFHVEPTLNNKTAPLTIERLEHLSYFSLSIAYLISIPFYIKLLSLFLLRGFNIEDEISSKWISTALLSIIGLVGFIRGFKKLESLEEYAVNIKLSIILSMIAALIFYNMRLVSIHQWQLSILPTTFDIETIRKLLGTIIIVQGFETSRFLALNYNAEMRAKTMRYAQIISGIIYIVFVGLSLVAFDTIHNIKETSIIDMSEKLSIILPYLLIIAALMSQFSAAIADTVGAGGLLSEASAKRLKVNHNYLIIAIIAIFLTWLTNIYQIITLASRAFALYYSIQSLEAIMVAYHKAHNFMTWIRVILFIFMLIFMLMVAVFGISV
jgi:hypothetical protein